MWACIDAGEAIEPGFELWLVEIPGMIVGEKGLPLCDKWLLAADAEGIGGENGNGGYCIEACRLIFDTAGDTTGSSSPKETPKARSLASASSLT